MLVSADKSNRSTKVLINVIIAILPTLIFDAIFMPAKDFGFMLFWWFILLLISFCFLPLSLILFNRFHDNGWIYTKPLGIALSGWILWYLSSFELLEFSQSNCIAILIMCALINYVCFFIAYRIKRNRKQVNAYNTNNTNNIEDFSLISLFSKDRIASMIAAETIFFCVFAVFCYIKGYNSSAYGTERFMDFGFINAMLKSEYMPPNDMWFSDNSINYYYVGQYFAAFLVNLTGIGAGYGYNLTLMTLPALAFSIAYTLCSNITRNMLIKKEHSNRFEKHIPVFAGILGGIAMTFAGNMHFPIYKWIVPIINKIRGIDAPAYYFPDSTRFIGYNPDTDDKTIHEFPSYSFVLGDLHAHVINIIFVLTVLSLLYAWMLYRETISKKNLIKNNNDNESSTKQSIKSSQNKKSISSWFKDIFAPHIVLCMFFIGLFHTTNYWDFPIYFVVCGAIILFTNLKTFRYKKEAWILTAIQAITFVIVWTLVALPFTLNFDSMATNIHKTDSHSMFYQLLILWGLPTTLVIVFLIKMIRSYAIGYINTTSESLKEISPKNKPKKNIQQFFPRLFDGMLPEELYIVTIGLCAIGLVLMPELIYVKDIYGGEYERANTMFKLTYQAYIMFAIAMALIIIYLLFFKLDKKLRITGFIAFILFAFTVGYFFDACHSWFTGKHETLDASAFLQTESPDDYKGIRWINDNIPDDSIVLEMCGKSYSFFNRVSVFTGNPTLLGWQTHEWLWRSSGNTDCPEEVTERHEAIITIYTSDDINEVKNLIDEYNIDYIYVGEAEYYDGYNNMGIDDVASGEAGFFHDGYYKKINLNNDLLKKLGKVHMISEATAEKDYETYIVEIER